MQDNGIQLKLSDIIFAIKKHKKMIIFFSVAGLILGILTSGISYLQGSVAQNFEIRCSFITSSIQADGNYVYGNHAPGIDDLRYALEMTDEAVYIIQSERAVNEAIDSSGLVGITNTDVLSNLSVLRLDESQIIDLKLNWRTAEEGIDLINALIDSANDIIAETMHTGKLETITEPYTKYLSGGGLNIPMWGYMLLFGFFAGLGISVVDLLLNPTLINLNDVEEKFHLEMFGAIPKNDKYFKEKRSPIIKEVIPVNVEQNYSSVAYILRNRLASKAKNQCIYVTSASAGEGKTSIASNVAVQLSDMEKKVLLVDLNIKNPEIGGLFLEKTDYEKSLNALYKGESSEDEVITSITGFLDILPIVLDDSPVPIDSNVAETVKRLMDKYDYVIIDAPSVGEVSDTLALNQVTNLVLFVIRYDKTPINSIKSALSKLEKSGTHVLGCIVNEYSSQTFSGNVHSSKSVSKGPDTVTLYETKEKKIRKKRRPRTGNGNSGVSENKENIIDNSLTDQNNMQWHSEVRNIYYETDKNESENTPVTDADMVEQLIKYGISEEDGSDGDV